MSAFAYLRAIRQVASSVAFLAVLACGSLWSQTAPLQPRSGPGGSDYYFGSVEVKGPFFASRPRTGDSGLRPSFPLEYFILQPGDPHPAAAPVVLFLHGWTPLVHAPGTLLPLKPYWAWMVHMVRKGHTVIWVGIDGLSPAALFAENALLAYRDALGRLITQPEMVRPAQDTQGFVTAITGHSSGGFLMFALAVMAANPQNGIPKPRALISFLPGQGKIPSPAFPAIDARTKVVIVAAEEDIANRQCGAVSLWNSLSHIPMECRNFLLVQSDSYGTPAQLGNHWFPLSSGFHDTAAIDARDFFVTYKLSVAGFNCAFKGTSCEYALGNGSSEQVSMGNWSDGQPVAPMLWFRHPSAFFAPICGFSGQ